MSDTNPGLPAPAGQPQGISPQPGQPQPSPTPNPAPANTPAATPPPAQPTPPAPDATKLQWELEQAQLHARALQSQKDQAEARLRAMAGVTPPQDPYAEDIAFLRQKGYDEQSARDMAEFMGRKLQPLQQHNQHLQAQLQGSSLAQQVMQAAADANPELFADHNISREVWESIQQTAQQGNLRALTPEYAKFLGAQAWALKHEPWKAANPTPPVPQPMPGFRPAGMPPISFGGSPGQYPPPPVQHNTPSPQQTALAAEMASYLKLPLNAPQT